MAVTVLIYNDATATFPDQAEPDQQDFVILSGLSGVITGGAVTANGSNMNLAVAAGVVVVNGVPVSIVNGSVTVGAASANPRWDMVVINSTGNPSVLTGTPSASNASLPVIDPTQFCALAAVFIPVSTSALTSGHLVDKSKPVPPSMQRQLTNASDTFLLSKVTGDSTNRLKITADGKMVWTSGSSGTPAPQLAFDTAISGGVSGITGIGPFNFTGAATTDVPLRVTGVGSQTADLLHIRNSTPTVLAKVDASGNLSAFNVKRGTGSPTGAVVGNVGDVYMQTDGGAGATLWVKETGNGNNSGWNAAGTTSAGLILGGGQCPTGTVVEYAGSSLPSGWLWCDGTAQSRTTYSALFAAIGTAYGAGNGSTTFNVPDKRGIVSAGTQDFGTNGTVAGSDRQIGSTVNATVGTKTHQLIEAELAAHKHTDGGHTHQQHGWEPTGAIHTPDAGTGFGITTVNPASAYPNIELGFANLTNTGANQAFSIMQPTQLTRFIVKY